MPGIAGELFDTLSPVVQFVYTAVANRLPMEETQIFRAAAEKAGVFISPQDQLAVLPRHG